MRFSRALVRPPGETFAQGLVRVDHGAPSLALALEQHAAYCAALSRCGLEVQVLPADPRFPDGCFVEDTAVLLPEGGLLTRPGAESRLGEVDGVRGPLAAAYPALARIVAPGTVDGGDICEAGRVVFIGLSARTNGDGAGQLAHWLQGLGYEPREVSIHGLDAILHLKSGMSWLGDGRLLLIGELAAHPAFADFERVVVDAEEAYAANAVRVNAHLLLADGYPRLQARLQALGYDVIAVPMSEYAKMDGGPSCLSLRY
jgi:dimethylargininase